MKEIFELLKERLGLEEKEANETFKVSDEGTEWKLVVVSGSLESKTFYALFDLAHERGGGYTKKPLTFTIPKTPSAHGMDSEPVYKEPRNEIRTVPLSALLPPVFRVRVKPEMELSELVESIKTYGVLEPIIVRPKGDLYEIVAGDRRVKAAKTAGLTEIPVIVKQLSDIDAFAIQLTENLHRTDLTPEEKSMALAEFAKFTKYNGKQIAVALSMSYRWVCLYLPQDFKDQEKARAGALGGESKSLTAQHAAARLAPKPQDLTVPTPTQPQEPIIPKGNSGQIYKTYLLGLRECEKCGGKEERDKMSFIDNKLVCRKCAGKDKPLTPRKLEQEPTFKPKETWEQRKAVMQPQKSKFELSVIQELQAEGLPLETDQEFCIQKTVPDAILKLKDRTIAVYIDNVATHQEGDESDEFLRSRLEKLHPEIHVCVVQYKNDSAEERQRAKETIKEYLKW